MKYPHDTLIHVVQKRDTMWYLEYKKPDGTILATEGPLVTRFAAQLEAARKAVFHKIGVFVK